MLQGVRGSMGAGSRRRGSHSGAQQAAWSSTQRAAELHSRLQRHVDRYHCCMAAGALVAAGHCSSDAGESYADDVAWRLSSSNSNWRTKARQLCSGPF